MEADKRTRQRVLYPNLRDLPLHHSNRGHCRPEWGGGATAISGVADEHRCFQIRQYRGVKVQMKRICLNIGASGGSAVYVLRA